MKAYRINGLCIRLLCAGLVFAAGCASQATNTRERQAQVKVEPASPQQEPAEPIADEKESDAKKHLWYEAAKEDLRKWPRRLIDDSKDSFLRPDNATALILAGGASIIMHNTHADTNTELHFRKHPSLHGFEDEALNVLGHPATHFGASAVWYFLSTQNEDDFNRQRAWTLRTALTVTWIATTGLKLARNNESPNGNDYAWPSGHTSSSFAVASVLDEFYGPKVGIPAYAAASAVAYRMMDTGDHWASDVVFGATLGWVVGHTVAGRHKKLEIAGFDIVPYVGHTEESTVGIGLLKQF
ncbi:MAG: phosphatase PAP2 family protein [Phycisphaerales bacterium]|nr:MAG: phosphatase PAP2 family protein [Phycisphaerales bacterium]